MERRELHETLEKLHQELHGTRSVSEADHALLEELMAEVRRVLDHQGDAPAERHQGLRDRLDAALYELEEDHPQLVSSVRNVVNYLSSMGI
jgi:ElaB/YqjD/DUF883 family membrane-anchored ribosome-binding protein